LAFDLVLPVWWQYSYPVSTTPYHHYLAYNFDADTIQFPQVKAPYTSLLVYISEHRAPSTYDRYTVSLSVVSPKVMKGIAWSGSQSSFWEASMRIEPCGNPVLIDSHHEINVSLDQGTQSNVVNIERFVSLVLEETLIPELPYSTYIVGDGLKRYRTVKMTQPEGYLMISLTSTNQIIYVSDVITEVILATGNQCIENYDPTSEYRITKIVPERVVSYTITLPATDIWYIAFVTIEQPWEITLDFMAVDTLPNNTLPDTPDTPLPPLPDTHDTPLPSTGGDPLTFWSDPSITLMLLILVVLLFILTGIMIVYICVFTGHCNFMNCCTDTKKEVLRIT